MTYLLFGFVTHFVIHINTCSPLFPVLSALLGHRGVSLKPSGLPPSPSDVLLIVLYFLSSLTHSSALLPLLSKKAF